MSGGHCTHPTGGPAIRLKHKKKTRKIQLEKGKKQGNFL